MIFAVKYFKLYAENKDLIWFNSIFSCSNTQTLILFFNQVNKKIKIIIFSL